MAPASQQHKTIQRKPPVSRTSTRRSSPAHTPLLSITTKQSGPAQDHHLFQLCRTIKASSCANPVLTPQSNQVQLKRQLHSSTTKQSPILNTPTPKDFHVQLRPLFVLRQRRTSKSQLRPRILFQQHTTITYSLSAPSTGAPQPPFVPAAQNTQIPRAPLKFNRNKAIKSSSGAPRMPAPRQVQLKHPLFSQQHKTSNANSGTPSIPTLQHNQSPLRRPSCSSGTKKSTPAEAIPPALAPQTNQVQLPVLFQLRQSSPAQPPCSHYTNTTSSTL